MANNFYAMLSRMKNINRWGLMRNVQSESLSVHSFEVAYIAHALALIGNRRLGKNYEPQFLATAALFHDTGEILTGDMPTPIKYYNEEIKTAYKQIEKAAETELTGMLPEDLRNDYLPLYNLSEENAKIIKAADKISALIKCTEELSMGNSEFYSAEKSTKKAIKALSCPEADIFLKEFMNGYSLDLDRQS